MALVPLKSLQSIMHILGKIPYGRKDGKAKGVKSLYFEMRSLSSFRTQLNETPSLIHRRLWTLLLFCIKPGKNEWKRISGNICYKENIVPGAVYAIICFSIKRTLELQMIVCIFIAFILSGILVLYPFYFKRIIVLVN